MDGAEWTLHGGASMTMCCALPLFSLLICAVVTLPAVVDTSKISSRLPHQILLNTSLQVVNPPLKMSILSVRWEHNGRPLVEYKDGGLKFHSPSALMSLEQLMEGNISLILTNLTLNHAGNYTCVVQYGGMLQTVIYALIIEPTRIRLLNLTPPPQKAGVTLVRTTKSRPFLNVRGKVRVTAKVGENATLPCFFNIDQVSELSALTVHWLKDGATKYFSNKTCCDFKGYYIPEDDLMKGHAPLQLLDVQKTDTGEYTCFIKYEAMEGTWKTQFQIQDRPYTTPKINASIVPASTPQYKTLKYGLVSGVVALVGLIAVAVYFCFPG